MAYHIVEVWICFITQPKNVTQNRVRLGWTNYHLLASVTFKGLDTSKTLYEVSISIGEEIPRILKTLKDSLRIPWDCWGLLRIWWGKITGFSGFWGILFKSLGFSRFLQKLYMVSGVSSPSVTFMCVFKYFVGVKLGALGIARTGTGIFCPGSSGIPFSIQVVEQKEPPSTFQDIPSQTIIVIPESALWKKFDQISRIFKHVD